MCSLCSRILLKNIFMNQFTKTHVPGFQIEQRAGNEWENRESWPRPFLALLLQSRILGPKWTFRKSSQRERASQSLFILLEGKKTYKESPEGKGSQLRTPQNPWLSPGPLGNVCEESKMLLFHPPPSSPTRLLQLT